MSWWTAFPKEKCNTYTFSDINENHSIKAIFDLKDYTILAQAGSNGTITPSGTVTVTHGGSAKFTFAPSPHYHVKDVIVDGVAQGPKTSYQFDNIVAGHTIKVLFAIDERTIVSSATPNGTISPVGAITVPYGSSKYFKIEPATGYSISDVVVDGVSLGKKYGYTFSDITTNHTIHAVFERSTFIIKSSAGANGTISPLGSTAVPYGGSQEFTFTPAVNYHVNNVVVDGVSLGPQTSYRFDNVTARHTIYVSFAKDERTIVSSAAPNGTISPVGTITVPYGSSKYFKIEPATGYSISDVVVDGVSLGKKYGYTFSDITTNHTIHAVFERSTFIIKSSAGANGTISPLGSTAVPYGGSLAFTFTPAVNYHVNNVVVDGVSLGPQASYRFDNVTARHTIYVSFAIDERTIVSSATPHGTISPVGTITVSYGSSKYFKIEPATGYSISDVVVDGVSLGKKYGYTFSDITTNHTIHAVFEQTTFTIKSSAGANGTISPLGSTVIPYGGSQEFTFTPAANYQVNNVVVDGVSLGTKTSYRFDNVTARHTIYVSFAKNTASIGTSAVGNWPNNHTDH